jgi:hypothetical protein
MRPLILHEYYTVTVSRSRQGHSISGGGERPIVRRAGSAVGVLCAGPTRASRLLPKCYPKVTEALPGCRRTLRGALRVPTTATGETGGKDEKGAGMGRMGKVLAAVATMVVLSTGTAFAATMDGTGGVDGITGGAGDDTIQGLGGNDSWLNGGFGTTPSSAARATTTSAAPPPRTATTTATPAATPSPAARATTTSWAASALTGSAAATARTTSSTAPASTGPTPRWTASPAARATTPSWRRAATRPGRHHLRRRPRHRRGRPRRRRRRRLREGAPLDRRQHLPHPGPASFWAPAFLWGLGFRYRVSVVLRLAGHADG